MMFFALWIPISERLKYAGYVITFLFAWYHYVQGTPGLNLKNNFITMQTFRDMILTCNAWIQYFTMERDINPSQTESFGRKLGSDACETLFSGFGGWGAIAGCRDITVVGAMKMFSKSVTLKSILSDEDSNGILVSGRAKQHSEESLQLEKDEKDLNYCKKVPVRP